MEEYIKVIGWVIINMGRDMRNLGINVCMRVSLLMGGLRE